MDRFDNDAIERILAYLRQAKASGRPARALRTSQDFESDRSL